MKSKIRGFTLSDVRTFKGPQHVKLAKINLLIGENNLGKSTLMECLHGFAHLANLNDLNDQENYMNIKPYSMGTFKTIARTGSSTFTLAMEFENSNWHELEIMFEQGSKDSLRELTLKLALARHGNLTDANLQLSRHGDGSDEHWAIKGPGFDFNVKQAEISHSQFTTWLSQSVNRGLLPFMGDWTIYRKRESISIRDNEEANFSKFVNFFRQRFKKLEPPLNVRVILPHALEGRRSYRVNPLAELSAGIDTQALNDLGSRIGLFDQFELREHAGCYEIFLTRAGRSYNLMDVGSGVTKLLPFLFASALNEQNALYLFQQPEAHLHPSAQARMIEMMVQSDNSFVIETHSDHVINWLNISVRENALDPSELSMIYFETDEDDSSSTKLHQMKVDELGNLSGQPIGYRKFFTEETARFLGLSY